MNRRLKTVPAKQSGREALLGALGLEIEIAIRTYHFGPAAASIIW